MKKPNGDAGFEFMADPLTREGGRAVGLRGRPLYHCGRGGALGDVPAEVVVAAFAFFPPEVVHTHWETGRQVMPPPEAALLYARLCNEWGRRTFVEGPGTERFLELLERVCDSAESAGLPLFAGWRRLPRPDDVRGRLAQVMNVMREHRGSVHACAVAAVGMHPLAANLGSSYGEAGARFLEWPEPYPDATQYQAQWQQAEYLTSNAAASAYEILTEAERAELVELVPGLRP